MTLITAFLATPHPQINISTKIVLPRLYYHRDRLHQQEKKSNLYSVEPFVNKEEGVHCVFIDKFSCGREIQFHRMVGKGFLRTQCPLIKCKCEDSDPQNDNVRQSVSLSSID